MSTLTSSRSPAASPQARAFHIVQSPRRPASALHARPPATSSPIQSAEQSRVVRIARREGNSNLDHSDTTASDPRYVDAATQYSPVGSPPTSHRSKVAPSAVRPGSASSGAQKRKGAERSLSRSPNTSPMSVVESNAAIPSSTAVQVESPAARSVIPQNEQESSTNDTSSVVAGPSEVRSEQAAEPQEARSTHGHSSAPKRSRPEPGEVKVMPLKYETCNSKDLGVLISNMLMELIRLNDQIPLRDGRLTRFHSRAPPGISVADYLQRLILHATLSPPILLSMVYYIDRLCNMYPAFTINSLTVHRFLITAATVASKGLSDSFWTNPTYARIGGIPVSELATLELEFLQRVSWKIVPQPEILEEYYRSLVERTQGFELEGEESEDSSSIDESVRAEDENKEEDATKTEELKDEAGKDDDMEDATMAGEPD